MKDYKDLTPSIQLMLEDAVSTDPYGLQPQTLYKNIVGSLQSGRIDKVAEIFDVSISLCEMIQRENEN